MLNIRAVLTFLKANKVNSDIRADGPMGPSRLLLSKPVIAAIAGHAVAGGLELVPHWRDGKRERDDDDVPCMGSICLSDSSEALWCDLRVMEEDAVLGAFCSFVMPQNGTQVHALKASFAGGGECL
jgi:enoyl-CoA hydratase